MLTRLKGKIQNLMRTEAEIAHRVGLKPNQISIIGLALGTLAGLAFWLAGVGSENSNFAVYMFLAFMFILSSGLCDATDGVLARLYGESSALGSFLDSLFDRYVDAFIHIGIISGNLCDPFWGLLSMAGSFLTSYVRAKSEISNIPMETVGIFERAERLLIIAVAALLNIFWVGTLYYSIIFLAIVTNATVLQRAIYLKNRLAARKTDKS